MRHVSTEAFDEKGNVRQLKLFPEDRAPETDDGQVVRIRMDALTVRNVRNWGEVWLGLKLPAQPPPKISGEAAHAAKTAV